MHKLMKTRCVVGGTRHLYHYVGTSRAIEYVYKKDIKNVYIYSILSINTSGPRYLIIHFTH